MNRNRVIEGCYLPENETPNGYVKLSPDKTLFSGYFTPPIKWTGYVGNFEVEIIQISNTAYSQSDFEFKNYPKEYDFLKDEIVKGIDDAMKVMD